MSLHPPATDPADPAEAAGPGPAPDDLERELETYRRQLTGYCYRMLGSGSEADDAVQETMIRAWRNIDGFEGRSSLRSWLYRIATNVCLDMLRGSQRRARSMDFGPASAAANASIGAPLGEDAWVQPVLDSHVLGTDADPAEVASSRETIRLAFVAALQHLPPRQRAVLILREVLRWKATEVAELLDTSVASVNSALQRARATLAAGDLEATPATPVDAEHEALLARYVDAFERYDITSLVALLHEDANFTMPPFTLWLRGHEDISHWYLNQGIACDGSRLVPLEVNGSPAYAAYKATGDGEREAFAIQVLEASGGRITGLHHFLGPDLFVAFGLPLHISE
ncbi:sigma-70 family RNA polymerase sigma factor [Iamia sp.]|uniref:sigma-70 family RNA polymerase sigma factor n=1 Tax=Iamia sp. TaxID=2722710 RepID=UPI002B96E4E0|nr:sigma-70 family RNA polymerase sigma factor [Iamia sp.]HXH56028.1 sigma-70 family RNA polymerase sigma factor [Iamia sp.]